MKTYAIFGAQTRSMFYPLFGTDTFVSTRLRMPEDPKRSKAKAKGKKRKAGRRDWILISKASG